MIRNIIKHSGIYILPDITGKLVGFLLLPLITHYINPVEYGTLEILSITFSIIGMVYTMGINSAVFRSTIYKDNTDKSELISTSFFFLIFTSILFLSPIALFSKGLSGLLLGETQFYYLVVLIAVDSFFLNLTTIPLARLRIEGESKKYSTFSVCKIFLNIGLKIYLIVGLELGLLGLVLSNLIPNIIFGLISIYLIKDLLKLKFCFFELKDMLIFGVPLIGVNLSGIVLNMGDRYVLKYLMGSDVVGIYSIGYKIAFIVMLFVSGFQIAWPKYLFEIAKDDNTNQYVKILNYFTMLMAIVVLLLSLFSKEVVRLMTSPSYHEAYIVVPLVSLGILFLGLERIICTGIHLKNKTHYQTISFVGGALLNICLNFFLIKRMGMIGAALATFLSYLAMVLFELNISQKLYRIPYDYKRIIKTLLIPVVIYFLSMFVGLNYLYAITIKLLLFALCLWIMYKIVLCNNEREIIASLLAKHLPSGINIIGRRL